jgi:hypothetical protein
MTSLRLLRLPVLIAEGDDPSPRLSLSPFMKVSCMPGPGAQSKRSYSSSSTFICVVGNV